MSLSLAIQQIQRGTWWYENDRDQSVKKPVTPEILAMRENILEFLRGINGKINAVEVQKHFGLTNSQLWHCVNPLVEDGSIIKYKPRHDRSLLEAAKEE